MKFTEYFDQISSPILPLLAPILASLGLFLLGWSAAHPVEIQVDDTAYHIRTHARTVAGALQQIGAMPEQADSLSPSLSASLSEVDSIELRRARSVLVEIDGDSKWVQSASTLPANLLQTLDIKLLPGDQLWADGLPYSADDGPLERIPGRMKLVRASDHKVEVASAERSIRTANPSLSQALSEAGYSLYEGDRLEPGPLALPGSAVNLAYHPSRVIEIKVADADVIAARVAADRVGQALRQAGVALLGLDYSAPAINQPLPDEGPIQVTQVREEVMVELEPVPFETQYQPLAEVEIDSKRVIETGAYGVRANQVRVRYQNGEEVKRSVEGNWLAREPDPRIVGYGTNIIVRTTSTADGTIEYWRAVEMWATSYSPSRAGVPDDYEYFGITASGKRLEKGLVAIDRSLIPFGTRMYVPGYGFAEAADTGGGVKGLWIDLGYEDDNWEPWAQYVTVYFLTPVPPASSITYILP